VLLSIVRSRVRTETSYTSTFIKASLKKLLSALLLVTASSALGHTHTDSASHSTSHSNKTDCQSKISPYHATYFAKFSGLNIDAVQKLEEIEPGIYRESLKAKNFIGSVNEQSTFKLTADHQLQPTRYSYSRSVFGRDRTEEQNFDWQSSVMQYQKGGNAKNELEIEPGVLDMITHRLQLRRDLNGGKQVFSYPVISRGKLKQYDYRVVSKQILETAIGPLNTVKVERVIDDAEKTVSVWLATDWDFLVVKLQQSKGKDGHHLELKGAVINNKIITPLAKTDEKQL
jgi:hypothetical protein